MMAKIQTTILSACGEHYVASYLSGLGAVVALTRARTPATDMIVTSETGGRSVLLQVKSGGVYSHVVKKRIPEYNAWCWRAGSKAVDRVNNSHWYAFVYIGEWPNGDELPSVFFVPSRIVAKTLKAQVKSQRDWFWMYESELEKYRGLAGFLKLRKML